MTRYKKGNRVTLSEEAIQNYGKEYRGKIYVIANVYTKYAPSSKKDMESHEHPGFDQTLEGKSGLYELSPIDHDLELHGDVYDWEIQKA